MSRVVPNDLEEVRDVPSDSYTTPAELEGDKPGQMPQTHCICRKTEA